MTRDGEIIKGATTASRVDTTRAGTIRAGTISLTTTISHLKGEGMITILTTIMEDISTARKKVAMAACKNAVLAWGPWPAAVAFATAFSDSFKLFIPCTLLNYPFISCTLPNLFISCTLLKLFISCTLLIFLVLYLIIH